MTDEAASRADADGDTTIRTAALRTGMRLSECLHDDTGLLLLAAGAEITPRFLRLLGQRNITHVTLRTDPSRFIHESGPTAHADRLDTDLDRALEHPPSLQPNHSTDTRRLSIRDLHAEARRGLQQHGKASHLVSEVCRHLGAGQRIDISMLSNTIGDFIDMVSLDADVLPLIVSLQQSGDEYLYDHCVNVAMLSMTMATGFGMPQEGLMELGLGALLQDIGMLRVPNEIRLAPRSLTDDEWFEVRRHPYYTIESLERIRGLPEMSKYIGYQVHERTDGSGYPRRRSRMLIHRYARIVAVADAYLAMTSPRPYREAMLPYHAAKSILVESSARKFDGDVVRGFLDNLSILPIGSVVELNNGARATVVRATPGRHTCPIVELLDGAGEATGRIIDLTRTSDRRIVRAVPPGPEPVLTFGHH
jgi:HD-GYP domain-containing protein (c-di-GMP phosphodiesterase class II)